MPQLHILVRALAGVASSLLASSRDGLAGAIMRISPQDQTKWKRLIHSALFGRQVNKSQVVKCLFLAIFWGCMLHGVPWPQTEVCQRSTCFSHNTKNLALYNEKWRNGSQKGIPIPCVNIPISRLKFSSRLKIKKLLILNQQFSKNYKNTKKKYC